MQSPRSSKGRHVTFSVCDETDILSLFAPYLTGTYGDSLNNRYKNGSFRPKLLAHLRKRQCREIARLGVEPAGGKGVQIVLLDPAVGREIAGRNWGEQTPTDQKPSASSSMNAQGPSWGLLLCDTKTPPQRQIVTLKSIV
jgi:hypothetical protein